MIAHIRYIVFFILFLIIQYCEGLPSVGGISFAQLWKLPILGYLLYCLYKYDRKWFAFEKFSYLYSVENFLCPAILKDIVPIIIHASKQIPLVLFFNFWVTKYKKDKDFLSTVLYTIAQYIAISSLLVLLGIVNPIRTARSADAYVENMSFYTGVFLTPHAASSYFCASFFILLYGFIAKHYNGMMSKFYNASLIIVDLYSIYSCYVRTGWVMLIVGCIMLVDFKKIKFDNFYKVILVVFIVCLGFFYVYKNVPAIRIRLSEKTVYSEEDKVATGSGRLEFWKISWENYKENNFYGLMYGKGYDAVKDDIYKKTRMRVFSHNYFVDSLSQYGIIALLLLLLYLYYLYRFIWQYGYAEKYGRLAKSMFISNIVFLFFQNEICFWYAFMFSLVIALMYLSDESADRYENFN